LPSLVPIGPVVSGENIKIQKINDGRNPFNIQLIEPKDHYFDSENRAERKHAKRKNATITKFGNKGKMANSLIFIILMTV
jgi:hypothetical protein